MTSSLSSKKRLLATKSLPLEKWRKRNLYYYQDLERLYKFFVRSGADVLEIGSGLGNLLNSVKPNYGLGIEVNPHTIDVARQKFPDLKFLVEDAEFYQGDRTFDYVILANTISYFENIQKALLNVRSACTPSTRVILTFHNPAWEPILSWQLHWVKECPYTT